MFSFLDAWHGVCVLRDTLITLLRRSHPVPSSSQYIRALALAQGLKVTDHVGVPPSAIFDGQRLVWAESPWWIVNLIRAVWRWGLNPWLLQRLAGRGVWPVQTARASCTELSCPRDRPCDDEPCLPSPILSKRYSTQFWDRYSAVYELQAAGKAYELPEDLLRAVGVYGDSQITLLEGVAVRSLCCNEKSDHLRDDCTPGSGE